MNNFIEDFVRRVRENKPTRWVRFGIVSLVFFLWVAWLGNWWVALWWLLLLDIYITGYIPFTWWKKSKSPLTRQVMSWVDAIVYALVLVYFVFTYVGQNYQIPSSSLEKTLMTGDYLWVNKMAYGPRVPMTPVHFPLVQNTFPVLGTKSYLERPQWKYHRLKGMGNVELGDIVVFNFPAGDSIALKAQNPDLYMLSRMIGEEIAAYNNIRYQRATTDQLIQRDAALRALGMEYIRQNAEQFGKVMWRPVDRRENYVKRAVGLPGQTFEIRSGEIYTDGQKMPMPENAEFEYEFAIRGWENWSNTQREEFWQWLGVPVADRQPSEGRTMPTPPLTAAQVQMLKGRSDLISITRRTFAPGESLLFPLATAAEQGWTLDDYGPVVIPAKGMTVELTPENWALYGHAIQHYELRDAEWRDGRVWIDGQPADTYTFELDYYFMMGDNRHRSLDSRFWGFVPEDHIVGRPVRVLVSFDPDGGMRWNRILRTANPDK